MGTGTSQAMRNGVRSVPGGLGRLAVRTITRQEHEQFVLSRPSVSFLQVPAWAAVKPGWGSESIGWTGADGRLVGAALVLYRRVPRIGRSLAYLPEGPVIDWGSPDLAAWLRPMVEHLRARGAFAVRIGPPVERRWWGAPGLRSALSRSYVTSLYDVVPDGVNMTAAAAADQLRQLGWRPAGEDPQETGSRGGSKGFTAGQPQYVFQVPLAGRPLPEVFASLAPQWRRNIRTAERLGVEVVEGGLADLDAFHELYVQTAARDGFTPRPREYFPLMWHALRAESPSANSPLQHAHEPAPGPGDGPGTSGSHPAPVSDLRLYLARHQGTTLAASIVIQVGDHVWYSYGASADHDRRLKPSNALQWRMLADAVERDASVYDLRGIGSTLDPEHPLFGLTRFKLGSGGRAVEYVGEWELPINRVLHRAMGAYLARR
jgi:lipid II:glycine glycyltransferase (peptidoglycan interpeptide bridge formation enzyme)